MNSTYIWHIARFFIIAHIHNIYSLIVYFFRNTCGLTVYDSRASFYRHEMPEWNQSVISDLDCVMIGGAGITSLCISILSFYILFCSHKQFLETFVDHFCTECYRSKKQICKQRICRLKHVVDEKDSFYRAASRMERKRDIKILFFVVYFAILVQIWFIEYC